MEKGRSGRSNPLQQDDQAEGLGPLRVVLCPTLRRQKCPLRLWSCLQSCRRGPRLDGRRVAVRSDGRWVLGLLADKIDGSASGVPTLNIGRGWRPVMNKCLVPTFPGVWHSVVDGVGRVGPDGSASGLAALNIQAWRG